MQPVCRELSDLVNGGYIQLISGSYNESEGSYQTANVFICSHMCTLLI